MAAKGTRLSSVSRRKISISLKGRTRPGRRNMLGRVRTFAEFMHNNRRKSGK